MKGFARYPPARALSLAEGLEIAAGGSLPHRDMRFCIHNKFIVLFSKEPTIYYAVHLPEMSLYFRFRRESINLSRLWSSCARALHRR